jgi:hypothetical protein
MLVNSLSLSTLSPGDSLGIQNNPLGHVVGYPESAGLNRHVVGDARTLQERRQRLHSDH